MRRSRKFEEELAVRKRPSAPVDEAADDHGLAEEALRLQELVGNTNTTAAIARSALQRDTSATEAEPMDVKDEKTSSYTMTMSDVGTFELLSLSWGQSRGVRGGEGSEGKVQYSDVSVSKRQDEFSAKLKLYAAEGRSIDTVEIVLQSSRGTMTITLKQVYISGFQVAGGQNGELPTETMTLTFGSMEYKLPEGK